MSLIRRIASRVDDGVDWLRMELRRIRGFDGEAVVVAHYGWGTPGRLRVQGQVVQSRNDAPDRPPGSGVLDDIRATLSRYLERGIFGARVRVRADGAEALASTDSDGFFAVELDVAACGETGVHWRTVDVVLEAVPGGRQEPASFTAEVMVVPAGARFGVISDIDDTVLKTGIHDFRANWRQVIENDPTLREAFPGLPELYQALAFDATGVQQNPIFYVSSAAWGFFDLFTAFMRHHDVPQGPLFLKNYGLDQEKWFSGGHSDHKIRSIERLFQEYSALSFILVGDSGQHDAMIYRDIVAAHPGRVLAVWIRDVADDAFRRSEIEALIAEVGEADVPAAFGPNLLVAAREAARQGWIGEEMIATVEEAVNLATAI